MVNPGEASLNVVTKENWANLLAYNLVRGLMAQAAHEAELMPLDLSFKAARQALNAFAQLLLTAPARELEDIAARLRAMVTRNRVGDRPDRDEPRAVKRRGKSYGLLTEPRKQTRARWRSGRYG
jgi:hypothetical protein